MSCIAENALIKLGKELWAQDRREPVIKVENSTGTGKKNYFSRMLFLILVEIYSFCFQQVPVSGTGIPTSQPIL